MRRAYRILIGPAVKEVTSSGGRIISAGHQAVTFIEVLYIRKYSVSRMMFVLGAVLRWVGGPSVPVANELDAIPHALCIERCPDTQDAAHLLAN